MMHHNRFFHHLKLQGKRSILVSLVLLLISVLVFTPYTTRAEELDPETSISETEPAGDVEVSTDESEENTEEVTAEETEASNEAPAKGSPDRRDLSDEDESSSEDESEEEPPEPTPTAPPYPASVTCAGQNKCIRISWSAVEGAQKYRIYRTSSNIQTGTNAEKRIAEVNAGTTSYTDTSVKDGIIYEYYVCAVNAVGESVRDSQLRGAVGWTSYVVPAVYAVRVTGLSPSGFTISGKVIASAGLSSVKIPTWTDHNGQDDIVWHEASVSGNSFSLYVPVSSHKNESGMYNCHIYTSDKNNVAGVTYAAYVSVPDKNAHLSDPCITAMHAGSYELALTYEAPAGVSTVRVATYTQKEGKNNYKFSNASVDSTNGIIRVSINAKDHGNYIGNYYTTVYLTDKNGSQDSHTFTVNFSGKEEVLNQVTTINCVDGDSMLVESNGQYMLIDAGPLEGSADHVVKVLKEHNANNLTVILTHPHSDHIEGLRLVADKFQIKEVYWRDVGSDYWFDNYIRDQLISYLKSKNIPVYGAPALGTVLNVGSLTATIIGPQRYYRMGESGATNNNSLAIRIEGFGKRILVAGDCEALEEGDLLAAGVDLKADVLKVSHHGHSSSSTDAFLRAVSPRYALISNVGAADNNVLNRLKAVGATAFQTKDLGSLCYAFFDGGKEVFMKHGNEDKNSSLKPALVVYGDINNDGKWDVIDVSYMYSHILNKSRLSGTMFEAADINGDHKVDVIDVSYIYSYILKKSGTVPQR